MNYSVAPMKVRRGPFPLVAKDQNGHRWLFNAKKNQFENIDIGEIIKVAGPLVVKYIVPFIKDLIAGIKESKNKPPNVPVPESLWGWAVPEAWSTPTLSWHNNIQSWNTSQLLDIYQSTGNLIAPSIVPVETNTWNKINEFTV